MPRNKSDSTTSSASFMRKSPAASSTPTSELITSPYMQSTSFGSDRTISPFSPISPRLTLPTSDGFILQCAPQRGHIKESALYHHVQTVPECLTTLMGRGAGKIIGKTVIQPASPNEVTSTVAILLLLDKKFAYDLFVCLPENIKRNFANHKLIERHIRIDKTFGTTELDKAKSRSHWHYTERIVLSDGDEKFKGTLIVHVHFHYGKLIRTIYKIEQADGSVLQVSNTGNMSVHASLNSDPALNIVLKILAHMNGYRDKIQQEFEIKLHDLSSINLKEASDRSIDKKLAAAELQYNRFVSYLEDMIDNRLELIRQHINKVRQNKLVVSKAENHTAKGSMHKLDLEQVNVAASSSALSSVQEPTEPTSPPTRSLTKKELNDRFKKYNNDWGWLISLMTPDYDKKGKIRSRITYEIATKFFSEVDSLLCEIETMYLASEDYLQDAWCMEKISKLKSAPKLYNLFTWMVEVANYDEAKKLFSSAESEIPPSFYMSYICTLSDTIKQPSDEDRAVNFCEFLFDKSQHYRMLLSLLHNILNCTVVAGKKIESSPLLPFFGKGCVKLFKLFLEQGTKADYIAYVNGDKAMSLIVFLASSDVGQLKDTFLQELIKITPKMDEEEVFAHNHQFYEAELSSNTEKLLDATYTLRVPAQPVSASDKLLVKDNAPDVIVHLDNMCSAPSALAAYCESDNQSLKMIELLAEISSSAALMYAFAYVSTGCQFNVGYCNEQYGLRVGTVEEVKSTKYGLVKSTSKYMNIIFASSLPDRQLQIECLCELMKSRLEHMSDSDLQYIFLNLSESRSVYLENNEIERCSVTNMAMLLISLCRAESLQVHKDILSCLIKVSEFSSVPARQSFFRKTTNDFILASVHGGQLQAEYEAYTKSTSLTPSNILQASVGSAFTPMLITQRKSSTLDGSTTTKVHSATSSTPTARINIQSKPS